MNISKISRSLIVAIFVAFILFLGVKDITYMNRMPEGAGASSFAKVFYFSVVMVLVVLYTYVREKLSRLKLQKPISTVYRYIYIVLVMIASTFFKVYNVMDTYPSRTLVLYFVLTFFMGFYTQRIIFNISKSDVLSVLGMFVAFTMPNVISDKTINLNSKFIVCTLLCSLYIMQTLIDELKQLNIKNKKYIKQALILGVCVGLSTLCGVSYLIWTIIAVLSLFITSNLDSTSLNLTGKRKKPTNAIKRKRNNYFIYKVERIKISKLLISLVIITVIATGIYFCGRIVTHKIADRGNRVCLNIINDLMIGVHSNSSISYSTISEQAQNFVGLSTKFYILCIAYIVFMELLALALHRKYDTKSTLIKAVFVTQFVVVMIFKLNMLYYQPLFTILLVIICIVDTTNIYYNREERIKMIEA